MVLVSWGSGLVQGQSQQSEHEDNCTAVPQEHLFWSHGEEPV